MIKVLSAILLTVVLLLCTFVRIDLIQNYPQYSVDDHYATFDTADNTEPQIKVDNTTSFEELLTAKIDLHGDARFLMRCYFGPAGISLKEVAATIGVECLRQPNDSYLYSVHRTVQGGILYVFYSNHYENIASAPVTNCFYVEESLSFDDFKKIKIGSSLQDVVNVDPTALVFRNIYYSDTDYFDKTGFGSLHYLSDGILAIGYETQNGIGKVSFIQLDKERKVFFNSGSSPFFNGELLEIDKIK